MTSQLTVNAVERYDDHYGVQFRDADEFDERDTPEWANDLAESAVAGSEVRMGQGDTDDWHVQSVRVPATLVDDEDDASRKALTVVTAVTEHEMYDSQ